MLFSFISDLGKLATPAGVRKQVLNVRFALRKHTSEFRVLPDFLILGTMRGGTSSLFKYLSAHPCVIGSLRKETWFFSNPKNFNLGEAWYRTHFPSQAYKNILGYVQHHKVLSFEASANYLYNPFAPERVGKMLPQARLIVMLRNPIDRLYSHYVYNVRKGAENRPLENILEESLPYSRLGAWDFRETLPFGRAIHHGFMYYYIGLYATHLQEWLKYFSLDNFLILKSEDFFSSTAETYQKILSFLELPSWKPRQFRNYSYWGNRWKVNKKPDPRMPEAVREKLKSLYLPENERLYKMLGRDFGWE
jgi:sulfotransferase family protein